MFSRRPDSFDSRQRLRLRRTLLGYTGYLVYVIPLGYAHYFGWLDWGSWGLVWIVLAVSAINAVFVGLIISGINQRFADPSMTLLQIAVATIFALIVISYAHQARGVMLLLFLISMFFGVFRLSIREFFGLAFFSGAGYFILLRVEFANQPFNAAYQLEVLRFITLMTVLLWFSVLGGYVATIRARLRQKNGELERALSVITAISRQDELTKTFNRRHILSLLAHEAQRTQRYGGNFAVCIVDIDNFKQVNDLHGHLVGDNVLRDFVGCINHALRGSDIIARGGKTTETFGRYGGEEFILLLPETDPEGALHCAERLRQIVASTRFSVNKNTALKLTLSAGVTTYHENDSVDALLLRADEALYRAKNKGRNCIVVN